MAGTSGASKDSRLAALAGELRVAIGVLIRRVREQTQEGDFTSAQTSVILRLERDGPGTVSMLAKAESVRHQSMRVTVASLETMGVVSGAPDPDDGRQTIFKLTPTFLKTLKTNRAVKEDWLFRALQTQLTPREQDDLAAAVKLIQRLADFGLTGARHFGRFHGGNSP
jgi:DNA-binding MarR family transcriptional regulator